MPFSCVQTAGQVTTPDRFLVHVGLPFSRSWIIMRHVNGEPACGVWAITLTSAIERVPMLMWGRFPLHIETVIYEGDATSRLRLRTASRQELNRQRPGNLIPVLGSSHSCFIQRSNYFFL